MCFWHYESSCSYMNNANWSKLFMGKKNAKHFNIPIKEKMQLHDFIVAHNFYFSIIIKKKNGRILCHMDCHRLRSICEQTPMRWILMWHSVVSHIRCAALVSLSCSTQNAKRHAPFAKTDKTQIIFGKPLNERGYRHCSTCVLQITF